MNTEQMILRGRDETGGSGDLKGDSLVDIYTREPATKIELETVPSNKCYIHIYKCKGVIKIFIIEIEYYAYSSMNFSDG